MGMQVLCNPAYRIIPARAVVRQPVWAFIHRSLRHHGGVAIARDIHARMCAVISHQYWLWYVHGMLSQRDISPHR